MSTDTGERDPEELHGTLFAIVPEWILAESGDVVKLYAILDRHAGKDRKLWPGQAELAERMGCSDRHVRKLLARLKELGALEVVKRRYNGSTIHRLVKDRPEQGFLTDRNAGSGLSGTVVPPNESHSLRATEREPPSSLTAAFDHFWKAYPRHEEKVKARAAWSTAVKAAGGDTDLIVQGAYRYRNDPNREDQFTPYPERWLKGQRWEDDPLPAKNGRDRPSKLQSTFDTIDSVFDQIARGNQ